MSQVLDYAGPVHAESPGGRLRSWGAFIVAGAIGVPGADVVACWHYDNPEVFTLGGLIASTVFLLVTAAGLAIAQTVMPRWFGSARVAFTVGVLGLTLGVVVFCVLTP